MTLRLTGLHFLLLFFSLMCLSNSLSWEPFQKMMELFSGSHGLFSFYLSFECAYGLAPSSLSLHHSLGPGLSYKKNVLPDRPNMLNMRKMRDSLYNGPVFAFLSSIFALGVTGCIIPWKDSRLRPACYSQTDIILFARPWILYSLLSWVSFRSSGSFFSLMLGSLLER